MIAVPEQFRPHMQGEYPPENKIIFEELYYAHCKNIETKREYLPIFPTSYYVKNDYGMDKQALQNLQDFFDSLDRSKKYYIIHQYDDGLLNDVSGINLLQFSMSKNVGYPLPLICMPHSYSGNDNKDIFANFLGSDTHPIRKEILSIKKDDCLISSKYYYIKDYCKVMNRSVFAYCPRGYGITSFRIMEALQYGAIPVYVSDEFLFPHNLNFNEYGITIRSNEVKYADEILRSLSKEQIEDKQQKGKEVYQNYFTFISNKNIILKIVNE